MFSKPVKASSPKADMWLALAEGKARARARAYVFWEAEAFRYEIVSLFFWAVVFS